MPRKYSIAEARSRLPSLVDEAESGIDVELTRRGRPVAVLVSVRELARLRGQKQDFGDAYRKFRADHPAEDGVNDDFAAGTRDRTPGRKVAL